MKVRPFHVRRTRPGVLAIALAALALYPACGSEGSNAPSGDVGTYQPDAGLFTRAGDASSTNMLHAHIEANRMTVTFITVGCTGPCADVVAVATGGYAPYTFKWDDGSTSAGAQRVPHVEHDLVSA